VKRFLIIRLSAIGDIVLTSPVIRLLHHYFPKAEIHYLTKPQYAELVENNPLITKVHLLNPSLSITASALKVFHFDYYIDLHANLRSWWLCILLGGKWVRVKKQNFRKMVWTQKALRLFFRPQPVEHIVLRYQQALRPLGIIPDKSLKLEFFFPNSLSPAQWIASLTQKEQIPSFDNTTIAVVLGATYVTKKWLTTYFLELLQLLNRPVLLLGGKAEVAAADFLAAHLNVPTYNYVNKISVTVAAAYLTRCAWVLTHDTGLMHIAAALGCKIISLWGNTVPEFGMTPWQTDFRVAEVQNLACRPCSRIGYNACPKGHFRCMNELTPQKVLQIIQSAGW
jgi:ADP-heptose:LPS heptosyltransferase